MTWRNGDGDGVGTMGEEGREGDVAGTLTNLVGVSRTLTNTWTRRMHTRSVSLETLHLPHVPVVAPAVPVMAASYQNMTRLRVPASLNIFQPTPARLMMRRGHVRSGSEDTLETRVGSPEVNTLVERGEEGRWMEEGGTLREEEERRGLLGQVMDLISGRREWPNVLRCNGLLLRYLLLWLMWWCRGHPRHR
ncbi:hypothetical protein BC829DRAFT_96573 [Chytridium lagenaria]|nr:hypothetical protein BC829DRAFT_96573 [Chytridium lagenaria]